MSVSVVIPWRETPDRLPAFEKVHAWWSANGFDVTTADSDHEAFNVAAARNAGVRLARHDKIIVADADTIPTLSSLQSALSFPGVTWPFDVYRYLGNHNPEVFELPMSPFERDMRGSVGGMFVTDKATYWAVGGQDERFTRWGYEDQAFKHAVITLSEMFRTDGIIYAYGHDAPRDLTKDNPGKHRVQLYMFASGKPEIMRELIAERI